MRKKELKLTTSALAKKADISPISITGFESGKSVPTIPVLEKLAKALEVELTISLSSQTETKTAPKEPFYGRYGQNMPKEAPSQTEKESTGCSYCAGDMAVMFGTKREGMDDALFFVDNHGNADVFYGNKRILHGWVKRCPMCGRTFKIIQEENVKKYLTATGKGRKY